VLALGIVASVALVLLSTRRNADRDPVVRPWIDRPRSRVTTRLDLLRSGYGLALRLTANALTGVATPVSTW